MNDEDLYLRALQEVSSGSVDQALMAKAWVECKGQKDASIAWYAKQRVRHFRKEARIANQPKEDFTWTGLVILGIGLAVIAVLHEILKSN